MSSLESKGPKFLLDENTKKELLLFLTSKKYDAVIKPKGLSNGKLAEFSITEHRVLVTNDRHFTNSSIFPKEKIFSVVLLKIPQDKTQIILDSFSSLLEKTKPEDLEGNLITLYENKFTIEPIPLKQ